MTTVNCSEGAIPSGFLDSESRWDVVKETGYFSSGSAAARVAQCARKFEHTRHFRLPIFFFRLTVATERLERSASFDEFRTSGSSSRSW